MTLAVTFDVAEISSVTTILKLAEQTLMRHQALAKAPGWPHFKGRVGSRPRWSRRRHTDTPGIDQITKDMNDTSTRTDADIKRFHKERERQSSW
ncbi:MAG: hypothetical protein ACE5EM_04225 [Sphingomonadales bacterium]